ncbi:MAG: aminopeptidase [Nitrospinota bacterium]
MEIVRSVKYIIENCVAVKPGENVLLVTDTAFDQRIVETFATLLRERGAQVAIVIFQPNRLPNDEPPPMVGSAMVTSNVIFELTSQWIGMTTARREACARGARYLTMAEVSLEMFLDGGPAAVDFLAVKPYVDEVVEKFTKARKVRVTSKAGTDLIADITGRKGRGVTGIATQPGDYQPNPDIEAGISPVEGSAEGRIIVDGLINLIGLGRVTAPFEVVVRQGRLTEIRGEGESEVFASGLRGALEVRGDPNVYNFAELSIGLNPNSRFGDISIETESTIGTAHFGMGDSTSYGGTVKANGHFDCIFRDVSFYLDDEPILEAGKLVVPFYGK